jgi:hypothetical protein
MTRIATIQQNIAETTELLRSYQARLADCPEAIEWMQHDLRSLDKLRRQLQDEFSEEANALHLDECRYRMFSDDCVPSLGPVTGILSEFQQLVSLVFHALQRKSPLERESLDAASVATTSFQIGYSFEGSVGFVLTLPNARLVHPDLTTLVDDSIDQVFRLSNLDTPQAVREAAGRFGKPVIRACYRWADIHVRHRIGSEAQWQRNKSTRSKMFVQYQQLAQLLHAVDATSDEETSEFKLSGVLTAANYTAKTFRFLVDGADEIGGRFEDAIGDEKAATVPAVYTAHIRRTSAINFATGEEHTSHFLIHLE